MRYRNIPPHNRPLLDARVPAVLIAILGLSCLPYIQVYPSFRSYVVAHLSRGIDAGLPPRFFSVPLRLIVADVAGQVQRVYVTEGSTVRAGDPLIQLDTQELLFNKRALESRIHRQPHLLQLYDDLEQTQLRLNAHTIISPVDGTVLIVAPLHNGAMLTPGSAIAVIGPKPPRQNPAPDL